MTAPVVRLFPDAEAVSNQVAEVRFDELVHC